MNPKTIISLLAIPLPVLLLLAAPAAQGQFDYTTNAGGITITGYTGHGGAVTIPSTITGLPVTSIGDWAFAGCTSLANVTIPGSVTSIGVCAFYYCLSVTSVSIPNSVTSIGEDAFTECTSLANVTIPGSVTSIGEGAFTECTSLTSVTICNGVTNIGAYAFEDCTNLTSVYFEGNAPTADLTVFAWGAAHPYDPSTVYYLPGTSGWGSTFAGLHAALIIDSLQVTITPGRAINAGAQWQVDGGAWENSGATVTNLSVGNHTVSFSKVSGWTTPANQTVSVSVNSATAASGTYVSLPTVFGESISGLYNTGVNNDGTLATLGAIDSHYTLASVPSGSAGTAWVVPPFLSAWWSGTTDANWLSPARGAGGIGYSADAGQYDYRLVFSMVDASGHPLDPTTATITGNWAADDWAMLLFNGAPVATNRTGFASLSSFAISSGFCSGTNTFDFLVINAPFNGANPTGLLVSDISGTAALIIDSLQVTITPGGAISAGAQWQVDGGAWQNSGATLVNPSIGNHTVSFSTVSGWTTPANQTVSVSVNSTTAASGTYVAIPQIGSLQVTISPAVAITSGAKWQVDGGSLQNSGATVTNLPVGNHTVSFSTVTGWKTPANQTVSVNANSTTIASGTYVAIGSLQVTVSPAAAITSGAKWQVDGGSLQNSGATITNLPVGNHTVSFSTVTGWKTPANQTVSIKAKSVLTATGAYSFVAQGIYNGLFAQGNTSVESSGMLSGLTVTPSGTYTGKLLIGSSTNAISGSFNLSGQASNNVPRVAKQGGPLTMSMWVNWNNAPLNISGTVSGTNGGAWSANLTAELAASGSASAEYTALLLPAGTPPGYGYILMTNHAGAVVFSVTLADGTSFSQSVPVSGNGDLPVYGNLYGSTGLLIGWLGLENGSPAGNLTWIKEASRSTAFYTNGFTNLVSVQGSPWINPLPHIAGIDLPSGQLDISGGSLLSPLSFTVALSNNNALVKLPGSPTNSLTGSIAANTGLLTITFGNGAGKATTAGTGAVLQNLNSAGGFFLGKTNAGSILLQP